MAGYEINSPGKNTCVVWKLNRYDLLMAYDAPGQRAVIWTAGFYGRRDRRYDTGRWKSWRPITRAVIAGIATRNPLGPDTSRISSFCDNVACNLVAGLIAIWHRSRRISYYQPTLRTPTFLTTMHWIQTDTYPHAPPVLSCLLTDQKEGPLLTWQSSLIRIKYFWIKNCSDKVLVTLIQGLARYVFNYVNFWT